jgi:hypothetical protein
MAKRSVFALIGLSVAICGGASALTSNDLAVLQETVSKICVQPDKKGSYLKIEGDLGAGAILKIVGVNGEGKVTKEDWEGISQRLDQYKTDPRQCAITVLPLLIGAMSK